MRIKSFLWYFLIYRWEDEDDWLCRVLLCGIYELIKTLNGQMENEVFNW